MRRSRTPSTCAPARARGGRARRRAGLRAAAAARRARAVPALAAARGTPDRRPASRRRRPPRWAPSAPACRPGAHGLSATRCSSPARTGCSTSCPGRTAPTRWRWQPQRDGLRARPRPTASRSPRIGPGFFDGSGLTTRGAARRPLPGRRTPWTTGSTPPLAAVRVATALARLPLLGRARQGRPRARLPVLGVGRRARGASTPSSRRLVRSRASTTRRSYITADHGMVDAPARPADRPGPRRRADAQACGTSAASRAPCSSTARPARPPTSSQTWRGRGSASAAWIRTRDEAVDEGWFGPVQPRSTCRASATSSWPCATTSPSSTPAGAPELLALLGLHGSLTRRGVAVPALPRPGARQRLGWSPRG